MKRNKGTPPGSHLQTFPAGINGKKKVVVAPIRVAVISPSCFRSTCGLQVRCFFKDFVVLRSTRASWPGVPACLAAAQVLHMRLLAFSATTFFEPRRIYYIEENPWHTVNHQYYKLTLYSPIMTMQSFDLFILTQFETCTCLHAHRADLLVGNQADVAFEAQSLHSGMILFQTN